MRDFQSQGQGYFPESYFLLWSVASEFMISKTFCKDSPKTCVLITLRLHLYNHTKLSVSDKIFSGPHCYNLSTVFD